MTERSSNGRRVRLRHVAGWLAVAAALVGVAVSLSAEPLPAPVPSKDPLHRSPRPAPAPLPRDMAEAPVPAPVVRVRRQNQAPHITSAALDRPHLCPGQSTLLRVTAEDGDDTDLRYQAATFSAALGTRLFGFGRWLRYRAPARPGRYELVSFVEDPSGARDSVPLALIVDDCAPSPEWDRRELSLDQRELDAQTYAFDLSRATASARGAGKQLDVLRWSFGDGTTAPGSVSVRHQYPLVMDRRYSYYLVQADVSVDGLGQRIEHGLTFYSYAAANLKGGYVALAADVERGDDRQRRVDYVVTFSNLTPYSANAVEFEVVCLDSAGLRREAWREPLDLTVPGESSLEQTLQLDRDRCPGGATYELFGTAEGDYEVGGLWSYKLRPTTGVGDLDAARSGVRARLQAGKPAKRG